MIKKVLSEKEIYFEGVYYGQCWKVLAGTETHIPYLSSNQEEADVRIMYHINDGVLKHGVQSAFVDSPDTDVFIILFFAAITLQKLFLKFGSRENRKIVPIHLLVEQLHYNLVSRLPAIHALSRFDTTSKVGPKLS